MSTIGKSKQLFSVGEIAILRSVDSKPELWNAEVTILSVKWMENAFDIHGIQIGSTFAYEIDIVEGWFVQSALKKKPGKHDVNVTEVIIKELEPA